MKVWQGTLIFLSGAVAGAIGSLFYLRGEFEKKVEEECAVREMAIKDLQKQQANLEKELKNTYNQIDSKTSKAISESEGYSSDTVTAMIREPRTERPRALKTQNTGSKNVVFSIDENGEVDDFPKEDPIDIPYGITSEDFLATRQEYDKTTLTFYMNDQVLANEDGDIVEDPRYLIGEREDWMKEVGHSEDNVAYIRNEKIGVDYEIICEYKSYTDDWAT